MPPLSRKSFIQNFEFNLPKALLEQLVTLFDSVEPGSLTSSNLKDVPEAQGVYQLWLGGELVYIGKTDDDAGLKKRLTRHEQKIQSRQNLRAQDVSFKAVRVYVFTAMDLETQLIKHYKKRDGSLSWNLSGFGSNDPGRNRDQTDLKAGHFDKLYPIRLDIDVNVPGASKGAVSVADVLVAMKEQLAYTVRFEPLKKGSKKPHADLADTNIVLPSATMQVSALLKAVKKALGPNWQITVLPGYVIVYKEKRSYPEGTIIS